MDAGARRPWIRLAATGALALAALLCSSPALADDPATLRSEAERLRAENDGIAARSQTALLELYALETRLRRAEARVSTLRARSAALARDEQAARQGLSWRGPTSPRASAAWATACASSTSRARSTRSR